VHSLGILGVLDQVLESRGGAGNGGSGGLTVRESVALWIMNLITDDVVNGCTLRGGTFSGRGFVDYMKAEGEGVGLGEMVREPFNEYDFGHIAMTYTGLLTLRQISKEKEANTTQNTTGIGILKNTTGLVEHYKGHILKSLKPLQQSNGSFTACTGQCGSESDMRFTFCAVAIAYMLGDRSMSSFDKRRTLEFIKNCRGYDGGFSLVEGQESHGGSTLCAVASLELMGELGNVLDGEDGWRDQLVQWCVMKQKGGLVGRTNKVEDSCYSFWVGGTLKLLGKEDLLDHGRMRDFLMRCQHPKFGGFGKAIGSFPDVLHSFYSLCWLSISKSVPNLTEVDVALGCAADLALLYRV